LSDKAAVTTSGTNWANLVTYARLSLIPIVVAVYYSNLQYSHLIAAILFTLASVSDWLDGYLARKLNQTSEFGAFLDPVADKLLVAVVLVLLVASYPSVWMIIPTAIMIARELMVSALREWMAGRNQRNRVAVAFSGKLKTTVQMIALIVLLVNEPSNRDWFWQLGFGLLYVSAFLSLWSMFEYFKNAWNTLMPDSEGKSEQEHEQ